MSDANRALVDNYMCLYTHDRCWSVLESDESSIDAAVTRYLETNGSRNTLLDLTTVAGGSVRVLASECVAWEISTPVTRFAETVLEKREMDENREHRKLAGYKDEEEAWKEAT